VQQSHTLDVIVFARRVQRDTAVCAVRQIQSGAFAIDWIQQTVDNVGAAVFRRLVERRRTATISHVWIGAAPGQIADNDVVTVGRRAHNRDLALRVGRIDVVHNARLHHLLDSVRRPRTHRRNNLVDNEWVAQKCADGGTFVSGRQKISIGGFFGTPSTNHRFGDVNRPRGGGGRVAARDSQKSFENSAIIGRCHLLRIKIQKCANFSKLFGARHAPTSPLVETSLVRADRLARLSTTQHSSFIHREQLAQCAPVCLARLTFIHRSKKKKALFFEQGKKRE
jgi:hypothetical protein